MNKLYFFLFLWVLLFSCRIIDNNPGTCFSCSSVEKDSCALTSYRAILELGQPGSLQKASFSRCGAGQLNYVRFQYSGTIEVDSAYIKITKDKSAIYFFPIQIRDKQNGTTDSTLYLQYQADGYLQLPLPSPLSFKDSCDISFLLRAAKDSNESKAFNKVGFRNISLQWTPAPE